MTSKAVTVIGEGCATGWAECPNGADAMTVIIGNDRLTSCLHRDKIPHDGDDAK